MKGISENVLEQSETFHGGLKHGVRLSGMMAQSDRKLIFAAMIAECLYVRFKLGVVSVNNNRYY